MVRADACQLRGERRGHPGNAARSRGRIYTNFFFSLYHVEPRVLGIRRHVVCARAQRALHAKTPLKGGQVARQLIGELHAQR